MKGLWVAWFAFSKLLLLTQCECYWGHRVCLSQPRTFGRDLRLVNWKEFCHLRQGLFLNVVTSFVVSMMWPNVNIGSYGRSLGTKIWLKERYSLIIEHLSSWPQMLTADYWHMRTVTMSFQKLVLHLLMPTIEGFVQKNLIIGSFSYLKLNA